MKTQATTTLAEVEAKLGRDSRHTLDAAPYEYVFYRAIHSSEHRFRIQVISNTSSFIHMLYKYEYAIQNK